MWVNPKMLIESKMRKFQKTMTANKKLEKKFYSLVDKAKKLSKTAKDRASEERIDINRSYLKQEDSETPAERIKREKQALLESIPKNSVFYRVLEKFNGSEEEFLRLKRRLLIKFPHLKDKFPEITKEEDSKELNESGSAPPILPRKLKDETLFVHLIKKRQPNGYYPFFHDFRELSYPRREPSERAQNLRYSMDIYASRANSLYKPRIDNSKALDVLLRKHFTSPFKNVRDINKIQLSSLA